MLLARRAAAAQVYFCRAAQYLRAMGEHMGVDWSMAAVWRPHARRLLRRHGRKPENWRHGSTRL